MTEAPEARNEPFRDLDRQRNAAEFGMWIFLATEAIFFGGMFLGYTVYRDLHTAGFEAAGRETNVLYGTVNTAILLVSSGSMAVTVRAGKAGLRPLVLIGLAVTALLGLGFLGVKAAEYAEDLSKHLLPFSSAFPIPEPGGRLFFSFYWIMTAVHAVHLTVGIGAVTLTGLRVWARRTAWRENALLHTVGLYWHLIDLIWIFLYPLFYLLGRG